MNVAKNLDKIRETILQTGRQLDDVLIVGAAKFQPLERLSAALAAGLRDLGDNQLQAGEALREQLPESVRWHFIGHIQGRKAKSLTPYHWVHSLDRLKIAETIHTSRTSGLPPQSVLIEVNLGNEPSKSGILPGQLGELLEQLKPLTQVRAVGLMCLPPPLEPVTERRPYFRELAKLAQKYQLHELSMGTSDDYAIALEEGATMIRLGTCLFGPRQR